MTSGNVNSTSYSHCAKYFGIAVGTGVFFEYSDKARALNTDDLSSSSNFAPSFKGISCSTQFDKGMFRK